MSKIKSVQGRQVFDSRGNPTVEAEVILQDDTIGSSIVPSGASTGKYEAHELRDKNKDYLNKSVFDAVNNINNKISKVLENKDSINSETESYLVKTNLSSGFQLLDLDFSFKRVNLRFFMLLGEPRINLLLNPEINLSIGFLTTKKTLCTKLQKRLLTQHAGR